MNKETFIINCAALLQGIVLVVFPAISTILTHESGFNFTNTMYGSLFVPQVILAIVFLFLQPKLSRRFGSKCVFLLGVFANFIAMTLLASSVYLFKDLHQIYQIFLCAAGFIGIGFGLLMPTLHSISALLHPIKVDSSLSILNALTGIGAALAPVLIYFATMLGGWWLLPAFLAICLLLLFLISFPTYLPGGNIHISSIHQSIIISPKFWLFAKFALLYGIIETLTGNWISIYMKQYFGANFEIQSLTLATFWILMAISRIFYEKIFPNPWAFQISPFLAAIAFFMIYFLAPTAQFEPIALVGLLGFSFSLLLPFLINEGTKQLEETTLSIPGLLLVFYLVGYGIAAFGVGLLKDQTQISLQMMYMGGAIIAVLLGILGIVIIQTKKNDYLK